MDVYYHVKFQLCITSGSKVSRGVHICTHTPPQNRMCSDSPPRNRVKSNVLKWFILSSYLVPTYKINKLEKPDLFSQTIICTVLKFAHLVACKKLYCTNLNTFKVLEIHNIELQCKSSRYSCCKQFFKAPVQFFQSCQ